MSKGEDKIAELLARSHIAFAREKSFNDLKHGLFRFDFYLPDYHGKPTIIEVDGEQHFKYIKTFFATQQQWRTALEHDRRKNSYCLANGIQLYRIPFWELGKITTVSDIFAPKFLVKTRWHNDYLKI